MTAEDVLAELRAAGVRLYLDEAGQLRARCQAGAFTGRFRDLVHASRSDLTAYLAAAPAKFASALAEVQAVIDQAGTLAADHLGRRTVLGVYQSLASRWHANHNPRLFEIADAIAVLAGRWREISPQESLAEAKAMARPVG